CGTGSDRWSSTDAAPTYHLIGVVDGGSSGSKSMDVALQKSPASDERVTAAPAVADDIVFFTTTSVATSSPCRVPSSHLYAMTFLGGAAYDTNGDGRFDRSDVILVKTVAGERATPPFVADRHLVFGAGAAVAV